MKQLVILRHGKSSWENPSLDDYDRPLNERGKKNATDMGLFLRKKIGQPHGILSSSAKRAADTAKLVAKQMAFDVHDLIFDDDLYLASVPTILKSVGKLPQSTNIILLIGHNPGLTDLVNHLGVRLDNLPTASAICFSIHTPTWSNISAFNAKFEWIKLAREL